MQVDKVAHGPTAETMNPYLAFLVYLVAILGFVALTLWLNKVVGPKPAPTPLKLEPFECGATPVQRDNTHAVPVKYYAIAVVFIFWGIKFESSVNVAAAKVNGEKIQVETVRRAWQDRQTELQQQVRDELSPEVVQQILEALHREATVPV